MGGWSPVLNTTHTWGLRGCCGALSLARTVPSSALAPRHHPWQRRTGALHPSPLAFEAGSNPGRKARGKWEERPEKSLLKALRDVSSLVASSSHRLLVQTDCVSFHARTASGAGLGGQWAAGSRADPGPDAGDACTLQPPPSPQIPHSGPGPRDQPEDVLEPLKRARESNALKKNLPNG